SSCRSTWSSRPGAPLPRLTAGCFGRARLGLWTAQAYPHASATPGSRRRLPRRAGGDGGTRCGRRRCAPTCTSRTRRIWRPTQSVSDVAPTGPTDAAARCRKQSARHGVWQRRGTGTGTHRAGAGRGDSAGLVRYLKLLEAHHQAVGREIYLVLANGSAHTSLLSTQALAAW